MLLAQGEAAQAAVLLEEALAAGREDARLWFLLGAARHALKNLPQALAAFGRALELDPAHAEAARACAAVLLALGRPQEARARLEPWLGRRPAATDFLVDAAIALEALGEPEAALARYGEALAQRKNDFRALLNRAQLLARLGRLEEALADQRRLVRAWAGSAAAHYNLADLLLRADRYDEALAACARALALAPRDGRTLMLRGIILAMLERDEEARASFAHARETDAAAAEAYRAAAATAAGVAGTQRLTLEPRQIRLARLMERQKRCDWTVRPRLGAGMRELCADLAAHGLPLEEPGLYHTALSLPLTAAEQQALAEGLARHCRALAGPPPAPPRRSDDGKIRLGFLSPNFRDHPSAQLNLAQFARRDRGRFAVCAYSLRPGEGPLREAIAGHCDVFREVGHLSDAEIAAMIRADGIDILIDLAGHLDHDRPGVLALHPAPLRVAYLGLPATMGAELVDYRLLDRVTAPAEQEAYWSERLVFLPQTAFLYDDREAISPRLPHRRACGLPESGVVFCCFNAPYKIEPEVFAVWMRLLAAVPGSVLWLIDGGAAVRNNLRREAAARGIDPARLVFAPRLPRAEHLARHACADLFLDTFYCGAMATAADALWAGLPVLTCRGETMAASQSTSIVLAAGLPELVAPDTETYEATALRLAASPGELAALRERLARNRSDCPLFDTARRVRELDRAFEMMWRRHLAGLPPESFSVPEGL